LSGVVDYVNAMKQCYASLSWIQSQQPRFSGKSIASLIRAKALTCPQCGRKHFFNDRLTAFCLSCQRSYDKQYISKRISLFVQRLSKHSRKAIEVKQYYERIRAFDLFSEAEVRAYTERKAFSRAELDLLNLMRLPYKDRVKRIASLRKPAAQPQGSKSFGLHI